MIDIVDATQFGDSLIIRCPPAQAEKLVKDWQNGKVAKLKPVKAPRSREANNYAWTLIDALAARLRRDPNEIYREQIKGIAGVSEWICVPENSKDRIAADFIGDHIGRQVEEYPSKIEGCVNLKVYIGSSDYDTEQMSRLIDSLIQDCKALGIPTEDDSYIRSLLEDWK